MTKFNADINIKVPSFFKDIRGRVVIFQPPNTTLIASLIFLMASKLAEGVLAEVMIFGFYFCLFIWGVLEVRNGASSFRKLLGAMALLYIFIKLIS